MSNHVILLVVESERFPDSRKFPSGSPRSETFAENNYVITSSSIVACSKEAAGHRAHLHHLEKVGRYADSVKLFRRSGACMRWVIELHGSERGEHAALLRPIEKVGTGGR